MNAQTRAQLVKAIANKQARRALALATVTGASMAALPARAEIDVAAVVTEIQGTLTPIGLIGAAVLTVIVGIAAFKWVRRAISG